MIKVALSCDIYDTRFHEGVRRYFKASGKKVFVLQQLGMPWTHGYDVDCDGHIVLARLAENAPLLRDALKKARHPLVSLGPIEYIDCPQVVEDNYAVGQLAAEYFVKRMFRRFMILGQSVDSGYDERIRGFEETLTRHGLSAKRWIYKDYLDATVPDTPGLGWDDYVLKHIGESDKPLAVLALDDYIGTSVIRHCDGAGIRVPEDVAILGVGNDHMICDYEHTPLSSIDLNLEQIGWKAAELLQKLMDGGKPPQAPLVIPPLGVIERRSSEILSAEDPRAMRALRYLMDNLHKSLKASDVARVVGLSSWQLDRIFVESFGRTVKKELLHLRNRRMQELLATTAIPAKEIATATGFRSLSHMTQVFIKENKISPKHFRDRLESRKSQPWDVALTPSRLIPHKVIPRQTERQRTK